MPDAASTAGSPALLSIREARVEASEERRALFRCAALELRAGEMALAGMPSDAPAAALADLATGLLPPAAGTVSFGGRDWASMSADECAAARGRIARVFAGAAWVSNLDIAENILLPALRHTGKPAPELRAAADALARNFGLDGLPAGRPAWADAHVLQACQWVRALLIPRELAVLEDPLRHVGEAESRAWRTALDEARAGGLAVLWIATGAASWRDAGVSADRRYRLAGGALEPATGGTES